MHVQQVCGCLCGHVCDGFLHVLVWGGGALPPKTCRSQKGLETERPSCDFVKKQTKKTATSELSERELGKLISKMDGVGARLIQARLMFEPRLRRTRRGGCVFTRAADIGLDIWTRVTLQPQRVNTRSLVRTWLL